MFYGGDHGMSFPFAKSTTTRIAREARYLALARRHRSRGVDREHLVSTLDFTPTLLDAAGLPAIPDIDGRSFLPAVKGQKMSGWDRVYTFYNATSGNLWVPMRASAPRTAPTSGTRGATARLNTAPRT